MLVPQQTPMIAELRGMLDELCSPELTLARAEILRPRLFELLRTMNSCDAGPGEKAGYRAEVESDRASGKHPRDSKESLHPEFTAIPEILQGRFVR
jgi:hypothetical protein